MKNSMRKLFHLPEELVLDSMKETGEREITLECHTKKREERCPHCGGDCLGYDHVKSRKLHTSIDGKKVFLQITRKRWQCKDCLRVFTEKVKGIENKVVLTDHFIQVVQEKARNRDSSSVAREMGIACSTVCRQLDKLDMEDEFHVPKKKN